MIVFRIVAEKYSEILSSSGSAARWNYADEYLIYTSQSRSLATLESFVNRGGINGAIRYKVMLIEIPDDFEPMVISDIPNNWRRLSSYPTLQRIGSNWYKSKSSMILQVPSAVIPQEYNFIINVQHPQFQSKVKIISTEDYFWDDRLSQK